MTLHIEDYALIGDCETAALVGRDGSIDWLCWPRFDSEACFAALLGTPDNGRWLIAPADTDVSVTRSYRADTLILETTFESPDGAATLVDFMPLRRTGAQLVRLLIGRRGRLRFCTELVVRFGYGAVVPWVTRIDQGLRAVAGPDMVLLRTPVALRGENFKTFGEFEVAEDETVPFVLTHSPSHLADPEPGDPSALLADTEDFWRAWSGRSQIAEPWSDVTKRSLITLKALTYTPTGGLVAAPTTSLPERLGGERNWDYRFCWLRDATMTVLALMNTGYYDEAKAWRGWLLRAVAGRPDQMQIMYGLAGERRLTEFEVPWLPGYESSLPVRIGNAAFAQVQLDVYGELIDALHQGRQGGLTSGDEAAWAMQIVVLAHLESRWREPDHGIWEVRSAPEHFTYSKVMAWVAFDRAIRSAEAFSLDGPLDRWRALRQIIHDDVCQHGYNAEMRSFVRAYGSRHLDASLLLLPAVGFLPPDDPRIAGTIAAVERNLTRDGLVMRYDTAASDDALPPGEGMFLACSFWLVDAYVLCGRYDEARALFNRLLALRNDVGLFSEQYDPVAGRMLGNFPQAFSHLALVNTACNLSHYRKPADQRAEQAPAGITEPSLERLG